MKKTLLALAALSLFSAGSAMADTAKNDFATAEAKWAGAVPMGTTNSAKYEIETINGADFMKNNRIDVKYDAGKSAAYIHGSEPLGFRLKEITKGATGGVKYANKFTVTLNKFQVGINTTNNSGVTIQDKSGIVMNVSGQGVQTGTLGYNTSVTADTSKQTAGAASFKMEIASIGNLDTATPNYALKGANPGDMINIIAGLTISDISGSVTLGATTK